MNFRDKTILVTGGSGFVGCHVCARLRQAGYRCAVCTIPGLQPTKGDLYEIRRVNVGADTSLEQFELRMAGL